LQKLDLSSNQLTSIRSVFYELSVVKKINLKGRQFNIFYDLPALRVVNLQENKNLTLDKRDFLKLVQTMEAQKEIELQDSGLTRADFRIDLGWIWDCGCEMQWLFKGPNFYSKYFVDICGDYYGDDEDDDGNAWEAGMTLEDLYKQDDFALENDDLKNKTILDLICPPDEEN